MGSILRPNTGQIFNFVADFKIYTYIERDPIDKFCWNYYTAYNNFTAVIKVHEVNKQVNKSHFLSYGVNKHRRTLRSQMFVLIVMIFYDNQIIRYFVTKPSLQLLDLISNWVITFESVKVNVTFYIC